MAFMFLSVSVKLTDKNLYFLRRYLGAQVSLYRIEIFSYKFEL